MLGDNLFFGYELPQDLRAAASAKTGATIFAYQVTEPQRYGVVEFDAGGRAVSLEEKPAHPKSRYAIPGLYFCDSQAPAIARSFLQSASPPWVRPVNMPALIDTGPLVAYLNRADRHYDWARSRLAEHSPPLLTCEAVLAETCFILAKYPGGPATVLELLRRGAVRLGFDLQREIEPVSRLMTRYANVPISLADASLVRMSEIYSDSAVLTLDSDFRIYRKHGRQAIPLIAPES